MVVKNWIETNVLQNLILDDSSKRMLCHLLYWDKILKGNYSKLRLKLLTNLYHLQPAIKDIGMKTYFRYINI